MNKNIIWLPSWYPNILAPYDGDFIQRHAQAVAIFLKITVIYIKKDEEGVVTKDVKTVSSVHDNLEEIIIFYHSARTGSLFLNRVLSSIKYKKVYKQFLSKYIEEKGAPDLIHVHVAFKAGLISLYLKSKMDIPFILSEHWSGYFKNAKFNIYNIGYLVKRYTKKILSCASLLLPVTEDLGKVINENLIKIPFEVVPNVVNTAIFYYANNSIKKFRFIHVSSLNYYKNPEGIIRAAKKLAVEGFEFELIMIGGLSQHLIELAISLSLDEYVVFKDAIAYDEVAKEMQEASSLILFSRIESLPCVILEALCCGLPVISSRVGGIAAVINESNGLLVDSENEAELTNAMKKMIVNHNFYDRLIIANNAAKAFSYKTVGKQIAEIYIDQTEKRDK